MKYYKNLYISEKIENKKTVIIEKLEKNEVVLNIYLITLAQGEQNHLEFFDAALLQQDYILNQDIFVVGLASGYDDALFLIEEITKEVYDNTCGTDIRNYILAQEKE